MNKFKKLFLISVLILINFGVFAQIPTGGISLIKETLPNYTKGGAGILTSISITGQPFTQGFMSEVFPCENIGDMYFNNW